MFRTYLIIILLHLGLIFQGCATFEYLDGSSKEEISKFKMTKEEIRNEMDMVKVENVSLQKQIDISRKENQEIRDENKNKMAMMKHNNELLNEQINKIKKEKQRISSENQVLTKKLTEPQLKRETCSSESHELEKNIPELKIKVLSGDGNLNSAKKMAKMLRKMGYKIKFIDSAPRSNFLQNTVYFAPKFQNEAKSLVLNLGNNTIHKPLDWSSIFDLIVVTGEKSLRLVTRKK